jgi:hypothetical protein
MKTVGQQTKIIGLLLGAVLTAAPLGEARAQTGIKLLMPAEDSCAALVHAMDSGDTTVMLSLGGWAFGFLSGIAQQSGKDILRNTTSQGVLDQLTAGCQKSPDKPMSSILEQLATTLMAGVRG